MILLLHPYPYSTRLLYLYGLSELFCLIVDALYKHSVVNVIAQFDIQFLVRTSFLHFIIVSNRGLTAHSVVSAPWLEVVRLEAGPSLPPSHNWQMTQYYTNLCALIQTISTVEWTHQQQKHNLQLWRTISSNKYMVNLFE